MRGFTLTVGFYIFRVAATELSTTHRCGAVSNNQQQQLTVTQLLNRSSGVAAQHSTAQTDTRHQGTGGSRHGTDVTACRGVNLLLLFSWSTAAQRLSVCRGHHCRRLGSRATQIVCGYGFREGRRLSLPSFPSCLPPLKSECSRPRKPRPPLTSLPHDCTLDLSSW